MNKQLLVIKIDNYKDKAAPLTNKAFELASEFYCETEATAHNIFITKNSQLTDNEFSALAGKLVMSGFNVELI